MGRMSLTIMVSEKLPYFGSQWRSTPLDWWSVEEGPIYSGGH